MLRVVLVGNPFYNAVVNVVRANRHLNKQRIAELKELTHETVGIHYRVAHHVSERVETHLHLALRSVLSAFIVARYKHQNSRKNS